MKQAKYLVAVSLFLFAIAALAQHGMDSAAERAVRITQGPAVVHNSGSSAVLEWTTDREAANRVQYRRAGSHEGWRKAFHEGGSRQHSMQLTGLRPGDTYEYEILTRDGDVRTRGQFRAEGHDRDHDRDHDHDHDRH
jgi:hypothetical protein